jgi:hypothetical protein
MQLETAVLPAAAQEQRELAPPPEIWIGERVAALAAVLGLAVLEYQEDAKPTRREIKARGAELLAEVVRLALYWRDFHAVARREGKAALRRAYETALLTIDDAWLDQLVEEALKMASAVVRKVTN